VAAHRQARLPPAARGERRAPRGDAAPRHIAIEGEPRYALDPRELAADATGYTADTLRGLHADNAVPATLYLLMGADQYAKLSSWHRPDEVKRLARLAVFARPGFELDGGDAAVVPMQPLAVSSRDIRARLARGVDIAGLVPPAVANYIRRHGLYS
jgi:nicotinate-nucleotide adenylyltransferase